MTTTWNRALITGASSGIGDALARRLAAGGTDLVIVARDVERLKTLAEELTKAHGVDVEVLPADLSDRPQLAMVEARLGTTERPIDLLVNNAGLGFNGTFGETDVDREENVVLVNVLALMRLSHAAIRRWRELGGSADRRVGGILNVSSIASFQPTPTTANYGASKAYVTSLGDALHEEHKGHGIVVSTLCPGLTRTEFQERGNHATDELSDWVWQSADEVAGVGLAAVTKGRATVVSGILNKSLQVGTRLLPMSGARWVSGQLLQKNQAKQEKQAEQKKPAKQG